MTVKNSSRKQLSKMPVKNAITKRIYNKSPPTPPQLGYLFPEIGPI